MTMRETSSRHKSTRFPFMLQTVLGYSVLPLTMSTQVLRSDGSLPVVKELLPMYLNVRLALPACVTSFRLTEFVRMSINR